MKIAISTESTCDLSKDLIEENDIKIIPYTVILGDEEVLDNEDVPSKIYEYVSKTKKLPKTSAINEESYFDYFAGLLKIYYAVIHISLSSGLSSSCSNAIKVSEKFKNVYVIDSKSLSTGIGLLVLYAKKLAEQNLEPSVIVEKVQERIPYVQASFVVDKLDYLYKGGRCNALSLFGANILKIHPQIVVKEGTMKPAKKYRGKMEKVIDQYCKDTLEEFNNADKSVAFVTHTTATEAMVDISKNALLAAGFDKVYVTTAGGTITSHCGENVLGVLYINDGKSE